MAKLVQFLKKKLKEKDCHEQQTAVPSLNIYQSYLLDDWEDVLTYHVSEEDVVAARESALARNDVAGALKMMFILTSHTSSDDLVESWARVLSVAITSSSQYPNILDSFARVERGRREKVVLNALVKTLSDFCSASASAADTDTDWEKRRDGVKGFALYCCQQGYLSFGFDLALSSVNYDEAFSILESAEMKGEEYVWMLQDVACYHVTPAARSVSFIEHCTRKDRATFAFSLAAQLQLWEKVEERIKAGSETIQSLRFALGRAVLDENWEVVALLLKRLPAREIREEFARCVSDRNAQIVIDLLLESDAPEALRLAASHRMLAKAAAIIASEKVEMNHELSVHVTNACFDNHCAPDQSLPGCIWDRDVLKHILDSPRGKPLSINQWEVVWELINTCSCPAQVVAALAKRAVTEDASCLRRFIGLGIDDELMDYLLEADPSERLSDHQLSCVAELLRRESAGGCGGREAEDTKNTDEIQTTQTAGGPEDSQQQATDKGPYPSQDQGRSSSSEYDWSTAIPVIDGKPVSVWYDVMKAAQTAKHSKHLRQLATKAACEGLLDCFICLAFEGLNEHPLDILIRLLHRNPEKLVLSYLKEPEQWLRCTQESCHRGWARSLLHRLDVVRLQCRSLVEERHRVFLLKRAFVEKDWIALQSIAFLDLTLVERKVIFDAAMQNMQWSLAMDVFDVLPDNDRVDPQVFHHALYELTFAHSKLINLMVERGLYNPYLTPEFFRSAVPAKGVHPEQEGRKPEAVKRKEWSKKSHTPRIREFWIPNRPVTEADKDKVTSKAGRSVERAAAAGDWVYVMNFYEGGLGGASKEKVLREAMKQDKWSSVIALIRRDPEAGLFYGNCGEMEAAVDSANWSAVEAIADKLATKEDRDWLLPRAEVMHRWSLVLKLVKKGVDPALCEQAVRTALAENEWSFVMDYVQLKEVSCPGSLGDEMKKEVIKMMARLLAFVRTPGQGEGEGSGKDKRLKGEDDEDGSTIMQMAARLELWKVCQVLLLCGVCPKVPQIPSILYYAMAEALRRNQVDVIYALLRLPATPATTDDVSTVLRDLLLTSDLDLDAESGVRLARDLLGLGADPFFLAFRRETHVPPYRQTGSGSPAAQQAPASLQGRDLVATGSGCTGGETTTAGGNDPGTAEPDAEPDANTEFINWIEHALKEADATTFQPCVMQALKSAICEDDFVPGLGFCSVTFYPHTVHRCPCTCRFQPSVESETELDKVPLRVDRERKNCPDVEILYAAWPDPRA